MVDELIIGAVDQPFPFRSDGTPVIEIKAAWADSWEERTDLVWVSTQRHTTASAISSMTFEHLYGPDERAPGEESPAGVAPINLDGFYVRFVIRGYRGGDDSVEFVGVVEPTKQQIDGSKVGGPRGTKMFTAFGGAWLLQKEIFESYVATNEFAGTVLVAQWIPEMNKESANGTIEGNRSLARHGGSYVYGTTGLAVWTNLQYAEYLLNYWMNGAGPIWTIGGQTEYLDTLTDRIRIGTKVTIEQLLMRLIPQQAGLDYFVIPTDDGFMIWVYALTDLDFEFAGYTIPKNDKVVDFELSLTNDVATAVVQVDRSRMFSGIAILGNRIIRVGSLEAGAIEGWWTFQLELDYKAGTGDGDDFFEDHDAARTADRFRAVFQRFRAGAGQVPGGASAQLLLDLEGNVVPGGRYNMEFRDARRTLRRLPLREGVAYDAASVFGNGGVPVDGNGAGETSDFLPPIVLIQVRPAGGVIDRWVHVDKLTELGEAEGLNYRDIGVSVLSDQWGVQLRASPNHALALNHMSLDDDGTNDSNFDPGLDDALDYSTLKMTIATEQNNRLIVAAALPPSVAIEHKSLLPVEARDAHFWYLAPNTIVDVGADGTILRSPATTPVILRDDSDKLRRSMPGHIARYLQERVHATITVRQLMPMGEVLGRIARNVDEGSAVTNVHAPITSVIYRRGKGDKGPTTTVLVGHAA